MKTAFWAGLALALAVPTTGRGATHTWTGNGVSTNWSDAGNWSGGVPVNDPAGLHLVFPDDATGTHTMVQDLPGLAIASMTLFTFGGNPYVLSGLGFTLSGQIAAQSGVHDIHVPVTLGADLGVSTSAFQGGVRLLGPVSGSHGIAQNGYLTLAGDNDFTGPVSGSLGGVLTVRHAHALGSSGSPTALDGHVRFEDYVYDPARIETIWISGSSVGIEGAGTNSVENLNFGPTSFGVLVSLDSGSRLDVVHLNSVPAPIQVRAPDGTMRILGPSAFAHQLEVREGTLVVNGAMPTALIRVDSVPLPPEPARVSGSGTIGALTVVNGDVSPGDPLGILTVNGDVRFVGASTLRIELAPGPDRIVAAGLVDLGNATLAVTRSFLPPLGTVFTLIAHNGNQAGQFAGLPNGATLQVMGQSFRIDYVPTAITLTALDELPIELESFLVE
jgi:hypothetical protein